MEDELGRSSHMTGILNAPYNYEYHGKAKTGQKNEAKTFLRKNINGRDTTKKGFYVTSRATELTRIRQ